MGDSNGGNKGKKPVVLDLTSPNYLHPSNHPGMNLYPVVLTGDNYQEWENSMRNAFHAKYKLGFLDGLVTKPDDLTSEIEDWWSVDSMIIEWVI